MYKCAGGVTTTLANPQSPSDCAYVAATTFCASGPDALNYGPGVTDPWLVATSVLIVLVVLLVVGGIVLWRCLRGAAGAPSSLSMPLRS